MGAYSREVLIKKKSYCCVDAYLRWALIWEWAQNRVFTVYIIYWNKSAHKSNSKLPFSAVKLRFHLLLLMITEHYSQSAQPTMKSHFSRYSSHVIKSSIFKNLNLRKKTDRNFHDTFLKNHFRNLKLYSDLPSWLARSSSHMATFWKTKYWNSHFWESQSFRFWYVEDHRQKNLHWTSHLKGLL